MSRPTDGFYVTGQALNDLAASYVPRRSDDDLYESLTRGEFCYVLTPSQTGKTSLMTRTAARLGATGVAVVRIDLTAIGQNLDVEQWYYTLLDKVGRDTGLSKQLREYWEGHMDLGPMPRWIAAIREVVLPAVPSQLVIFVDEIGFVHNLPFSADEFFAGIRACHGRRVEDPEMGGLTFCLLGVATPSDLLRDPRTTAFNIGRRIDLYDFTAEEAAPLARGLGREDRLAAQLMDRILYWTGGQPYLTQRLCQAVAADSTVLGPAGVDRVCEQLFLGRDVREQETNLKEVERQMLQREGDLAGVLDLYRRVRRWQVVRASADPLAQANRRKATIGRISTERVPHDATNPVADVLRISGITRVVEGYLWVRNRIYYRVFDNHWIRAKMPEPEKRRQRAAFVRGAAVAASIAVPIIVLIGWLTLQAYWNRVWATANEDAAEGILTETHKSLQSLRTNGRLTRELLAGVKPNWLREALATAVMQKSDPVVQRVLRINLGSYESLDESKKRTTMYLRVMGAIEHDIGNIAYDLEDFLESERSHREAVDHQREACELARRNYPFVYRTLPEGKAKIRGYQILLNKYYASLIAASLAAGRGTEGEKAALERKVQCAGEPDLLYDFARVLVDTGRTRDGPRRRPAQEERARLDRLAVWALEQAIAEGYRDVARLRRDSDFDPIRTQPDYVRVVGGWDARGRTVAPK